MKSGLYAWAGASATASAAACAKRFDEPITNESNVYFGFIVCVAAGLPPFVRRGGGGATLGLSSGSGSVTVSTTRRSRPVTSRTAAEMKPRKWPSIHSRVKSFGTLMTKASSVRSVPPAPPNQVLYVVVFRVLRRRSATSAHNVSAVTRSSLHSVERFPPKRRAASINWCPEPSQSSDFAADFAIPHSYPQLWKRS